MKTQRRSGRRLSAENEALLQEALAHYENGRACVQKVLDSNDAGVQAAFRRIIERQWTHAN